MRLYGLYLEHRLAYVTKRIEAVASTNAGLEERYSSLLSPSRIYNYAKSELKMVTASEVETIRLRDSYGGALLTAGLPDLQAPPIEIEMPGFVDFFISFAGIAHAQD